MIKREELETALLQAEAAREYLEAALIEAKAALVDIVTDASKIDANREEARTKVEKARARCRQLRAALANPSHSEFITRSRERIETPIKRSDKLEKREATANPISIQPSEQFVDGERKESIDKSKQRKMIHRFNIDFSARERRFRYMIVRSPLVRQTIGLLALVLAYLLYFHIDIRLQILRLPVIFTLLVS